MNTKTTKIKMKDTPTKIVKNETQGEMTPKINKIASASINSPTLTSPNKKLNSLMQQISSDYKIDSSVEDLLLEMSHQFIEDVIEFSAKLARHRNSKILDPLDIKVCLEKNYGMSLAGMLNHSVIPAPATPSIRSFKKPKKVKSTKNIEHRIT